MGGTALGASGRSNNGLKLDVKTGKLSLWRLFPTFTFTLPSPLPSPLGPCLQGHTQLVLSRLRTVPAVLGRAAHHLQGRRPAPAVAVLLSPLGHGQAGGVGGERRERGRGSTGLIVCVRLRRGPGCFVCANKVPPCVCLCMPGLSSCCFLIRSRALEEQPGRRRSQPPPMPPSHACSHTHTHSLCCSPRSRPASCGSRQGRISWAPTRPGAPSCC